MADSHRVGDIEVAQDLEFQRHEWVLQRALWVAIAILLLAALAGLFGSGPLSRAEAVTTGLALDYERLARRHAPHELTVEVGPEATTDGTVALWIDQTYLDGYRVESIMPEPESVETGAQRVVFRFAVGDVDAPAQVVFALEPERVGPNQGRLGLAGGPELAFRQFVFP